MLDTRMDTIEHNVFIYFSCCMQSSKKGLSIDGVGVSRDTVFLLEIRTGAGFETGDFVREKLGAGGYRRTALFGIKCLVVCGYYCCRPCMIFSLRWIVHRAQNTFFPLKMFSILLVMV